MSVRPSGLPPIQDMPPPGGFAKIDTLRHLPVRGPSGAQLWFGTILLMSWGFYRVGVCNNKRVEQKLENRRVRYAISPLLQAEADFEYLRREEENLRREREVMKNVPGWKVGEPWYFSNKFMPRAVDPMRKT